MRKRKFVLSLSLFLLSLDLKIEIYLHLQFIMNNIKMVVHLNGSIKHERGVIDKGTNYNVL